MNNTIKDFRTDELVTELKHREGVDYMMIRPSDKCEVYIEDEFGAIIYDALRQGPEVIFRVID